MASPFFTLLVALLFTAFFFLPSTASLPVIVLHGISDQCANEGASNFTQYLSMLTNSTAFCLEIGSGTVDSWFMPLDMQVEQACQKVKKLEILHNGYNIVAISQGNLIARGLIEYCDDAPPVRNFISLGGPHAGVASVPLCGSKIFCSLVDDLIKYEIYSDFVQENLAPSGYLKIPKDIPNYLKGCRYLPKLNNEISTPMSAIYKQRFTSLHTLVLIMFQQDTVIVPRESSWFGYYPDGGSFDKVLATNQTRLYIEDWIGLKAMDEAGRVKFISVQGKHVEISDEDLKKHVVPYLVDNGNLPQKHNRKLFMTSKRRFV